MFFECSSWSMDTIKKVIPNTNNGSAELRSSNLVWGHRTHNKQITKCIYIDFQKAFKPVTFHPTKNPVQYKNTMTQVRNVRTVHLWFDSSVLNSVM